MQLYGCLRAAKCSLLCRYVTRERVEAMLDYEVRHCSFYMLGLTQMDASPLPINLSATP